MQVIDPFVSETQMLFSQNFKKLLSRENLTQKELAAKMNVLESTISNCNKKLPTCEFLLKLKKIFPELSFDQLLFGDIDEVSDLLNSKNKILAERLPKFTGVYYVYYLDTSKKKLLKEGTVIGTMLRTGLIFIFNQIVPNINKALCLAVFGLKQRDEAETIRKATESMHSAETITNYLRENWKRNFYKGTFDLSQSHIYIQFDQDQNNKDTALIIMHHTEFNKEHYIGGLGTINSTSSGRPSDPVVQIVGISRYKLNLTDQEIFKKMLFFKASISFDFEVDEILRLAKRLYDKKASVQNLDPDSGDLDPASGDFEVFKKYIPDIIKSNMEQLLTNNIERNTLWFGKISGDRDQEWYEILKQQTNKRN